MKQKQDDRVDAKGAAGSTQKKNPVLWGLVGKGFSVRDGVVDYGQDDHDQEHLPRDNQRHKADSKRIDCTPGPIHIFSEQLFQAVGQD